MRQLFRSKIKVTQEFGVNADYYKQFGLKAHEGLDVIPTGTVWDVLCLADGVVVKDEDNALSGAYGRNVTVWHPKLNKATQYCHLKENYVVNGQVVSEGDKLGLMGATGNTSGAHVHLNLFETDENGVRLNRTNGYLGGINPLPFLEEETTLPINITVQKDLDTCRIDRDGNHNDRMALYEELGFTGVFNRTVAVEKIRQLLALEKQFVEKDGQLVTAKSQISLLEERITELNQKNEELLVSQAKLNDKTALQQKTIDEQGSEIKNLSSDIEELRKAIVAPHIRGWVDKLRAILNILKQ